MDTRAAVAARIESLCEDRKTTINALAYISGVPNSTIKGIFYKRSKNLGVVTIQKICEGLGITLGRFFSMPGFGAPVQEIK